MEHWWGQGVIEHWWGKGVMEHWLKEGVMEHWLLLLRRVEASEVQATRSSSRRTMTTRRWVRVAAPSRRTWRTRTPAWPACWTRR